MASCDASQALQHLSAQVVNAGAVGIELQRGVNLGQRFRVSALTLINPRELKVGTGELRIEMQRLAKHLLRFLILLLKVIHLSQLVVVVTDIRLDGDIFEELRFGVFQILLLQVSHSKIEVDEGKGRIALGREFKFGDGLVILFPVEVSFAHQEMKLGRVLPDLNQMA